MQMPSHYTPNHTELASGLYLIATPIGNLSDISLRALNTLASVELIACEDTRVSKKLLNYYGISTPLESYHEHNAAEMRPKLIEKLKQGARIALISDAGTPLISDPGYKLVKQAIAENIQMIPIPGASSILAALCMAGLPTDKFCFLGFLPTGVTDATTLLSNFSHIPASLILFSTPSKCARNVQQCLDILGNRDIALCRELTKMYEEAWRGSISELLSALENGFEPRGEIVLVIAPPTISETIDPATLDATILEHLSRLPLKSAVQEVAELYRVPRNKVYQRALELKK